MHAVPTVDDTSTQHLNPSWALDVCPAGAASSTETSITHLGNRLSITYCFLSKAGQQLTRSSLFS